MAFKPKAIMVTAITRPKNRGDVSCMRVTLFSIWNPLDEAPTSDATASASENVGAMESRRSEPERAAPSASINRARCPGAMRGQGP